MDLQWAVIPTAGRGTRMYPAAAVVPKALLPVGVRPMLQWALEEAVGAGIPGIVIVRGPEQALVEAFVTVALEAAGDADETSLARLGRRLSKVTIRWVVQPHPLGVGDAFARCREVTGSDPFGVLLPDNWFHGGPPAIGQVAETLASGGCCTLGLTAVAPAEAHLFGNVGGVRLEPLGGRGHRILALQDKLPGTFEVPAVGGTLRGCARYALTAEFYDALAETGPPEVGEWDDVPAFQRLVAESRLNAHEIEGRHYDVGLPDGYLAAAAYLAGVGGA